MCGMEPGLCGASMEGADGTGRCVRGTDALESQKPWFRGVWPLNGFCEAFPEPILEFNPEGRCWSSAFVPASALTLGRAGL